MVKAVCIEKDILVSKGEVLLGEVARVTVGKEIHGKKAM